MSQSTTLNVRGFKLRTASYRRYIVAVIRTRDIQSTRLDFSDGQMTRVPYTIPAGAFVLKRSDNLHTARTLARYYGGSASYAVVVDRLTGEEVA